MVEVEKQTRWKIRDTLHWKKPTTTPFQTSPRNVSRIVEMVFVLSMDPLFITNKTVSKIDKRTGQKFYGYVDNFIEARGSDSGTRKHHKATFSVEFATKLIEMYFPKGAVILDPFCGTGTTGVACKETARSFIMMDISQRYVDYAKERVGTKKRESAEKRKTTDKPSCIMDFFLVKRTKKKNGQMNIK